MSLEYKILKEVSEMSDLLGKGLRYGGFGALLAMTVIGAMSVDIVILAAILNNEKRHSHSHVHFFYCSSHVFSYRDDPSAHFGNLILYSLLMTTLAVVLSVVLSVPGVGLGLTIGWASVAGLFASGELLLKFAQWIKPDEAHNYLFFSNLQTTWERTLAWIFRPSPVTTPVDPLQGIPVSMQFQEEAPQRGISVGVHPLEQASQQWELVPPSQRADSQQGKPWVTPKAM